MENQPEIEIAINGQLTQIVSKIEDGIIPKNKASMVIRGRFGTRPVAVRMINETNRQRYDREAQALERTKYCKSVTTYIHHAKVKKFYLFIMPLYEFDLHSFLGSRGNLPLMLQHSIVFDIARGLIELHSRGIVFCDLRPSKIFLVNDCGRARIMMSNLRKCKIGSVMTAPLISSIWASPEVVASNSWHTSESSDSYSLALIAGYIWIDATEREHYLKSPAEFGIATNMLNKQRFLEHHLLVDMMSDPITRISVVQASRYPLFWGKRGGIKYIQMLYDKIQEEKLSKVETNDNKTGLKAAVSSLQFSSWKKKTDEALLQSMENPPNMKAVSYKETAEDLIKFLRHLIVHFHSIPRATVLIRNKEEMSKWIFTNYWDFFVRIFKVSIKFMEDFFRP